MANNLSNAIQPGLINSIFGKTPNIWGGFVSPPTIYVALCTAAPTNASTGSTIVEATYTGYARKVTAAGDWAAATGSSPATLSNANAITFAPCTGGSSTVTHFALCDAASAGNVILWGALASSLAVSNGITPSFAVGALQNTDD